MILAPTYYICHLSSIVFCLQAGYGETRGGDRSRWVMMMELQRFAQPMDCCRRRVLPRDRLPAVRVLWSG